MSEILQGFNSDILYQGRTYHIQTEDWGLERAMVVTRVYISGTVVQSIKTPYESLEKTSLAAGQKAILYGMRSSIKKF